MSSYLSIVAPGGNPLGTPDQVVARIAAAVPEVQWAAGPSSFEETKALAALQIPWTDEQRAVFSLPKRTGTYEGEGYSVRLDGFESCPLTSFTVDVAGEGNPLPFLRKLCLPNGWAVVGYAGRERFALNLEADPSSEWQAFRQRESAPYIPVGPPNLLRIPLDEHRFDCVGRLDDGTQFMAFGTGCFPDDYILNLDNDDWQKVKRCIAVLHLFDADGNHLYSESSLGGYAVEDWEASEKVDVELEKMLAPLRKKRPKLCDIYVKLFSVVLDGVTHGLFYTHHVDPEENFETEWVMLEPRDIMFHPPWDSGEYST